MTPVNFKPQNFFDSSLCEALDRLARAAGIIDAHFDPTRCGTAQLPTEKEPWLYIDSRRLKKLCSDGPNELDLFLAKRHFSSEAERENNLRFIADGQERLRVMGEFENAVRPLFIALQDSYIVAQGYVKRKNGAEVNSTSIDAARWSGDWLIRRNGNAAVCELFADMSSEDPEAILSSLRLVAPVAHAGSPAVHGVATGTKRKGGRRPIDDRKPLEELMRILEQKEERTLRAAVLKLLADKKVIVDGTVKNDGTPMEYEFTNIYERLRGKLNDSHEIIENADGVTLIPRIPNNTKN